MNKIILSLLLFSACNELCAMQKPIILPSRKELTNRLEAIGLEDFNKKTKIDLILGGQTKYPHDVADIVNRAFKHYLSEDRYEGLETINQKDLDQYMQASKKMAIEVILQDHPKALEELRQRGLLQQ
jgi:hypothetical protein